MLRSCVILNVMSEPESSNIHVSLFYWPNKTKMHTHTNELTSFFFNVLLPHPKGQPVTFSKHISSSWCWDEKRNKKIMHQCKQKKQSWNLWFGSGHTHKSFINVNMTIILNLWSDSGHTHTQKKSFINVNMTIIYRSMPAGVAQSSHAFVGGTVSTWARWWIPINKGRIGIRNADQALIVRGEHADRIVGSPSW